MGRIAGRRLSDNVEELGWEGAARWCLVSVTDVAFPLARVPFLS